ncbi:unnamed protein product [Polarella glacialis]|uniref:J domain-containing protein n=1 Tax=Polarella glacialis TaxID=89957 RepID=A0A813HK35_POLGL|nr:unnamed protein product [Polarella glacialis]CAE8652392.1 unnamed protein product [Polarella glacialis]
MGLYELLGISGGASEAEIRSAYRRKALECHPDKPGGDAASFLRVVEAFEVLADPVRRARYEGAWDKAPLCMHTRGKSSAGNRPCGHRSPSSTGAPAAAREPSSWQPEPKSAPGCKRPFPKAEAAASVKAPKGRAQDSAGSARASTSQKAAGDSAGGQDYGAAEGAQCSRAAAAAAQPDDGGREELGQVSSWLASLSAASKEAWPDLMRSHTLMELEAVLKALTALQASCSARKPRGAAKKKKQEEKNSAVGQDITDSLMGQQPAALAGLGDASADDGDETESEQSNSDEEQVPLALCDPLLCDAEDESEEADQEHLAGELHLEKSAETGRTICHVEDQAGEVGEKSQDDPQKPDQPQRTKLKGIFAADKRRGTYYVAIAIQGLYIMTRQLHAIEDAIECHVELVRLRHMVRSQLEAGCTFEEAVTDAVAKTTEFFSSLPCLVFPVSSRKRTGHQYLFRFTTQNRTRDALFQTPKVWDLSIALANHRRALALKGLSSESSEVQDAKDEMRQAARDLRKTAQAENRRLLSEAKKKPESRQRQQPKQERQQEQASRAAARQQALLAGKKLAELRVALVRELRRRRALLQKVGLHPAAALPGGLDCILTSDMNSAHSEEPFVFAWLRPRLPETGQEWTGVSGPFRRSVKQAVADLQLLQAAQAEGGEEALAAAASAMDLEAACDFFREQLL